MQITYFLSDCLAIITFIITIFCRVGVRNKCRSVIDVNINIVERPESYLFDSKCTKKHIY